MFNKIDNEYEYSLVQVNKTIKSWKRSYFRKNAKCGCSISLKCNHTPLDPKLWKYWVQLERGGKNQMHRIQREVYEIFSRDEGLEKVQYTGMAFVLIDSFTPGTQE